MSVPQPIDHASHSIIGGRDMQQDCAASYTMNNGNGVLMLVADGMGGRPGGQYASAILDKAVRRAAERDDPAIMQNPKKDIDKILKLAYKKIQEHKQHHQEDDPYTTMVILFCNGSEAWWAHLGDCRCYHFKADGSTFRSKDHSVVQQKRDAGEITEEEMGYHEEQNQNTSWLGGDHWMEAEHGHAMVSPRDMFLLCSDGLWEEISGQEMPSLITQHYNLQESAVLLCDTAFSRAGEDSDNISVAICQIHPVDDLPTKPHGAPATTLSIGTQSTESDKEATPPKPPLKTAPIAFWRQHIETLAVGFLALILIAVFMYVMEYKPPNKTTPPHPVDDAQPDTPVVTPSQPVTVLVTPPPPPTTPDHQQDAESLLMRALLALHEGRTEDARILLGKASYVLNDDIVRDSYAVDLGQDAYSNQEQP